MRVGARRPSRATLAGIALLALAAQGCAAGYVMHAAYEEARLLWRRQPVKTLLAGDIDPATRAKLELTLEVRRFAAEQLGLNVGGSYESVATVDGVSMQQGFMSQGGMVSIFQDFPMSADMVSEVKVLSSSHAPEYGGTTGGQIQADTGALGCANRFAEVRDFQFGIRAQFAQGLVDAVAHVTE